MTQIKSRGRPGRYGVYLLLGKEEHWHTKN